MAPSPVSLSRKSDLSSSAALSPNIRIAVGICFALVGIAGLYADSKVLPQSKADEIQSPISIRVVDRSKP